MSTKKKMKQERRTKSIVGVTATFEVTFESKDLRERNFSF